MAKGATMNLFDDDKDRNYVPRTTYIQESDLIIYVRTDSICLYERIDEFVTIIRDIDNNEIVGFQLKRFQHALNNYLSNVNSHDVHTALLIDVIYANFNSIYDLTTNINPQITLVYQEIYRIASADTLSVDSSDLAISKDANNGRRKITLLGQPIQAWDSLPPNRETSASGDSSAAAAAGNGKTDPGLLSPRALLSIVPEAMRDAGEPST
jgi:hypothetical protein